jgi:hypothetical protein
VFIGILIILYFVPFIVALRREKENTGAILLLNIFLGWTLIGWVIALVWAATKDEKGLSDD